MPMVKAKGMSRVKLAACHAVRVFDSIVFFLTLGFYDPELYPRVLFSAVMDE